MVTRKGSRLSVQPVTKAEYDALKTGMTYLQAVGIVGDNGEELSRNELAGYVTVMVRGDVGAVKAATEAGQRAAERAELGAEPPRRAGRRAARVWASGRR